MTSNISFIYFDLGDTLVHVRPERQTETVKRIAEARGQTLNTKRRMRQALAEYKAACDAEWATRFDDILNVRSHADERAYWPSYFAAVLKHLEIASPDKDLIDLLAQRQADPESFVCVDGAQATLDRLAHAGIELGVISNSFPSAERILEHRNLSHWFNKHHLVLSHEVLYAKPTLEIYQHAIDLARRPADQIMFVDDRLEFVRGAALAGLVAVLFDPREHYQSNEWAGITIRRLAKLIKLAGNGSDSTRPGRRQSASRYVATAVNELYNVPRYMMAALQRTYRRLNQI